MTEEQFIAAVAETPDRELLEEVARLCYVIARRMDNVETLAKEVSDKVSPIIDTMQTKGIGGIMRMLM